MEQFLEKKRLCGRCLRYRFLVRDYDALVPGLGFCQECSDILDRERVGVMNLYGHICKNGHGYSGEKHLSCPACAREAVGEGN